jgi:hypothetical protein
MFKKRNDAPSNERLSQSTDDTLNKLSDTDIGLLRIDYDIKQIIENITIDSHDGVD